jgi:tetraacyldisaccharide 4'-kinase
LNVSGFREVVSGERRGLTASLLRGALRIVETPYSWAVVWRNQQFDSGRKPVERVAVPVISVGNLSLGGTGKTPMVEWLANRFSKSGVEPAIVSRGYGAKKGVPNDEALELAAKLPGVPHVQNPDRVAGVRTAIEQFGCRLVLLDDGFQHRRIHRDLDIVLLDALEPFGYCHMFPRGMLREPLSSLHRADVVALSRADLIPESERERIRAIVRENSPDALWIECRHAPVHLRSSSSVTTPLIDLANKPIAAFCGIGNPGGFRRTVEQCGYQLLALREFPDHFAYQTADLRSLTSWAADSPADAVLCTHKDLVKLGVDRLGEKPLWALMVGLEITAGREGFEVLLKNLLAGNQG